MPAADAPVPPAPSEAGGGAASAEASRTHAPQALPLLTIVRVKRKRTDAPEETLSARPAARRRARGARACARGKARQQP